LDNGEAGTIVKMTARAAILQTIDGRWIIVPNEDFITSRVVNFSDAGAVHRYAAEFQVSYETDINLIPPLIEAAVAKLDFVLQEPEPPECELRGFGDSSVNFAVEYWVEGIEDLPHKYRHHVLMCVWNTLREQGIEIPFPQRVIHHRMPETVEDNGSLIALANRSAKS
jgi:small-conductance mechanosensitive channel